MASTRAGVVPATPIGYRTPVGRYLLALIAALLIAAGSGPARAASPANQLTWGVHVSLAPTWFDPAEMSGIITPYMVL